MQTTTVDGQPVFNYQFDDADRLMQITQSSSTVAFGYDDDNRRTSLTLPNGVSTKYVYDAASRLTSLTYKKADQSLLGNLTYGYDNTNQGTSVGGSFARTGLPQPVAPTFYDPANELAQWGTSTLTYDADGNLANDGLNTYTRDSRNQLAAIAGGTTASFAYDPTGRRSSKTIAGNTTGFFYNGENINEELSGAMVSANIWNGGTDDFFQRADTSGAVFPLTDALGSVLALTDLSGNLATQYSYEPFGGSSSTFAKFIAAQRRPLTAF